MVGADGAQPTTPTAKRHAAHSPHTTRMRLAVIGFPVFIARIIREFVLRKAVVIILIVAIGKPKLITADMVKEGAVIIDVGTNRIDDPTAKNGKRLVGDVDFDSVKNKVSAITPVPGGVGPMTICMLMSNTVTAAERRLTQ